MSEIKCIFNGLSEHDMDMMFLQLFSIDPGFARLFLNMTPFCEDDFSIDSIELSKADLKLGESDITVLLTASKKKVALLIEDKIDAIAMPEQASRYIKRGDKDKKKGEYDAYFSFIVCPQKYYDNNEEAHKYPNVITYETIRKYLSTKDSPIYCTYCQQLDQAIEKAKRPPKVEVDENANRFFRKYKDYQEENYPELNLTTKRDANGYWAHYTTRFGTVYLYHKIETGFIDLTFNKASDHLDELTIVAEWLRKHGFESVSAVKTGMAGALRVIVPKLNNQIPFEENDNDKIETCFRTISKLIEAVNVFGVATGISDLK
ncbi:PD-(D/E)XK nuclease superfamily protein [Ruminococcaceae bacterium YAD3003]|nr:PD-(D/E)XK nuclease superfamily protein [Ruminococcaceae bacterium YAD3003]